MRGKGPALCWRGASVVVVRVSLTLSLSAVCVCVWVVCVHTISTRMHIVDWGRAETDTDHEVMYNTRAAHTCSPVKCTHTHIYI